MPKAQKKRRTTLTPCKQRFDLATHAGTKELQIGAENRTPPRFSRTKCIMPEILSHAHVASYVYMYNVLAVSCQEVTAEIDAAHLSLTRENILEHWIVHYVKGGCGKSSLQYESK